MVSNKKKRSLKFKHNISAITSTSGRKYEMSQVWPKRKQELLVDTSNHNAWRRKETKA